MDRNKNILIVGVGGQGVLLASEIICNVALKAGYDAKKSEVHGMAQRGGVVSSHVRFGKKVYSPLIKKGDADIIVAFEKAEALRWVHYLKEKGTIIINDYKLIPPISSMKGYSYPENPIERIKKRVKNVVVVDCSNIAERLGNLRLVNTILLGVLSSYMDISEQIWTTVIEEMVPKGTEDLNKKAFREGRSVSES